MTTTVKLSFLALLVALGTDAARAALANPSFEATDGWTWIGPSYSYRYRASSLPGVTAHQGEFITEMTPSSTQPQIGVSQVVTAGVTPGQYWTFSGYAMNYANSSLTEGCYGVVTVEYIGGTGGLFTLEHLAETTTGVWLPFSLTTTSPTPEGVTGVRFSAYLHQPEYASGALLYDDFDVLSAVPEIPTTGIIVGTFALICTCLPRLLTIAKSKLDH